jgi:hypothetical protein
LPAHRDYRGGNAGVGVLLPATLASQVRLVGGPQSRGDVLQIRGIFHRVDATGEVAVIHAETGQVASQGRANPDPILTDRRIVALVAFAIAVAMVVAERRVAARR